MPGFARTSFPQPDTPIGGLLAYNFNVQICALGRYNPVNMRRWPNVGLMTACRRWLQSSIKSPLGPLVLAGNTYTTRKWKWTIACAQCTCTAHAHISVYCRVFQKTQVNLYFAYWNGCLRRRRFFVIWLYQSSIINSLIRLSVVFRFTPDDTWAAVLVIQARGYPRVFHFQFYIYLYLI